ncbi:MAG: hypothetical protein PHY28_01325 [Dehalococcoidales bacterium]|nr:hypothetical protein [Dehalococcoidales bacterium]
MNVLDEKFKEWTEGKNPLQARINIFEKIRDVPYAIIPEFIDYQGYIGVLKAGRGSCSPKHFLMCEMFQRLGLTVLFVVYPHRWDERAELLGNYSSKLKRMAQALPVSHHIACKVEIEGRFVLVDATLDLPLVKAGLPVNKAWDGRNDTMLPMTPCGDEDWYHPSEAHLMRASTDEQSLAFYAEVNAFLEWVRRL